MNNSDRSYPRPDFDRSARWQNLDGTWQFARGPAEHVEKAMLAADSEYPERILVPFPWESQRSGVEANWLEQGWYRRTIEVPEDWGTQRTILHFGGVHYRARVFVNGWLVGDHVGAGPFECDIASSLRGRSGDLVVAVDAPVDKRAIAHGKQRSIPADDYDGCAFQPSSGIWQPVWLEPRPATFLRSLRFESTPTLDAFIVRATVEGPSRSGSRLRLLIRGGEEELEIEMDSSGLAEARFALSRPRPWSPEDPYLYVVDTTLMSQDGSDEVSVSTGLRRIEIADDEIRLNGRRLYLRGVLDQGYWPDCGLSAPSPEALRRDLELARASGYNLVRKHLKLEDPRWLHLADTMGMLVWEEPPSTSRYSVASVAAFHQDVEAMVARDANHPSTILWGLFNEEWGLDWKVAEDPVLQQVVRETVALVRSLDPSRPAIDNSGWSHVDTDVVDWHYYEPDLATWAKNLSALVQDDSAEVPVCLHPHAIEMKPLAVSPRVVRGRPNLNGEYGAGLTSVERGWYLKWQTQELRRYDRLSGYVYTELYDIEHEFAGLYRFDRESKDLANLEPCQANAENVLVLGLLPEQPGVDVQTNGGLISFEVRLSHHGTGHLSGLLLGQWGPHLGPLPMGPRAYEPSRSPELQAEPFILGPPVLVRTQLPSGWSAGRLHLWLESEGTRVARTSLDVVSSEGANAISGSSSRGPTVS